MASEVKERLLEYLYYRKITQAEFTRMLGVSGAYIGAMRQSMSDGKIARMRRLFPDLNTSWLLYGEGKMINEEYMADSEIYKSDRPSECRTMSHRADAGKANLDATCFEVPLLPVSAYAGNLQMWSDGVMLADCEKVISPVKGADFAIRVTGDSMEPEIHDGTTILIKRINEKAFIPWGCKMVIDTENGVLVKTVYPSQSDKSMIEARSCNPKYPPLDIPKRSIYGLYRILGSLSIYSTM